MLLFFLKPDVYVAYIWYGVYDMYMHVEMTCFVSSGTLNSTHSLTSNYVTKLVTCL